MTGLHEGDSATLGCMSYAIQDVAVKTNQGTDSDEAEHVNVQQYIGSTGEQNHQSGSSHVYTGSGAHYPGETEEPNVHAVTQPAPDAHYVK